MTNIIESHIKTLLYHDTQPQLGLATKIRIFFFMFLEFKIFLDECASSKIFGTFTASSIKPLKTM